MDPKSRSLFSLGSLALLAVLFVALTVLSSTLLKGYRLDLTENRLYTLSEGTRNVLKNLEEPVRLYFFFSEEASRDLPQIRSYARWVREMLEEFEDRSSGRLRVTAIDPAPFSPEEDQAAQFGLQAVPVGAAGDMLYFGIAGSNTLDELQSIPFLQPSKEQFLEYDLAKMIYSLSHPEQKRIGLLSGLPMEPGFDPATQGLREAWTIYSQLEQMFEIEIVAPAAQTLPAGLDLLFVVHPKAIDPQLGYAIDQFVLGGGRLVAFMDPFAESDLGENPNDPMARLNAGSSSTLGDLLDAWGVRFDTTRVVGDLQNALQVGMGDGMPPVRHLGIMSVKQDGLNADDIVSADLDSVNFSSVGWLEAAENATTTFETLAETSENAAPIDAARLRFLSDPSDLIQGFQPTGDRYTLAARVTGPAVSAFKTVPEDQVAGLHLQQSGDEGINIILFADSDMLTDRFWVQKQNFLGQSLVSAFADNGTLVVNAVDNLLGSTDLISIRTRTSLTHPFERVDALRLEAESRYRETEERLQRELEETERTLSEMQAGRNDGELTVLNDAQQQELQGFLDRKLQIRSDLRQVRHDLERDIDLLGTRLKVINIILMPSLVILAALFFGRQRRRRREGTEGEGSKK
jgi:ABC-type uncharacterized transport system involved in gliding motility auxiliary subunit